MKNDAKTIANALLWGMQLCGKSEKKKNSQKAFSRNAVGLL
jgi:hypothetical protein